MVTLRSEMLQCVSTQIKLYGIATRKQTMYLFSLEGDLVILRILKHTLYFFFFLNIYLLIWPQRVLAVSCGTFFILAGEADSLVASRAYFLCGMWALSSLTRD